MNRMLLGVLPFLLLSCDSNSSVERPCFLRVGPSSSPIAVTVTYSALRDGDASIRDITYRTNDGDVVVERPDLPWTKTVGVESKKSVGMEVNGTVEDGALMIVMEIVGEGGGTSVDQMLDDSCSSTGS